MKKIWVLTRSQYKDDAEVQGCFLEIPSADLVSSEFGIDISSAEKLVKDLTLYEAGYNTSWDFISVNLYE